MGIRHTIESERQKGFSRTMFFAVARKLATDFNSEIYFWIQQGYELVLHSFKKMDFMIFDIHRRIVVSRIRSSVVPSSQLQ